MVIGPQIAQPPVLQLESLDIVQTEPRPIDLPRIRHGLLELIILLVYVPAIMGGQMKLDREGLDEILARVLEPLVGFLMALISLYHKMLNIV